MKETKEISKVVLQMGQEKHDEITGFAMANVTLGVKHTMVCY